MKCPWNMDQGIGSRVDRQSGAIKDNCGGFPWDVDQGIECQSVRQLSIARMNVPSFLGVWFEVSGLDGTVLAQEVPSGFP